MLGALHARLYQPAGQRAVRDVALLALPMQGGLTPSMDTLCDWLADAGFTSLLWDPYSGQPTPVQPVAPGSRIPPPDRAAFQEHIQWLDYLEHELGATSIAVIGWCLGGRMVFPLGEQDARVRGCVSIYPVIRDPQPDTEIDALAAARGVRCPVQLIYGTRDHTTTAATYGQLWEALQSRSVPTMWQVYPEAEHGFMFEGKRETAVNALATRLSWPQILGFLHACLKD
jgi:carboxymethylenebutenolidase